MNEEKTLEEIFNEYRNSKANANGHVLNASLYDFYKEAYPEDTNTDELFTDRSATFLILLFYIVSDEHDVYELFDDSTIRERLFEELSKRLKVPYNTVYDAWLRH